MLRILCYKNELSWPRLTGHDIALYHLMQQFARLGATVGFAVNQRPSEKALDGLSLEQAATLADSGAIPVTPVFTKLQAKYQSYWGIATDDVARLGGIAREFRADAVVVSGLAALPMLGGLDGFVRVWHASDEWCLHHLSLIRGSKPDTWKETVPALIKAAYERSYGSRLNRVWVVTNPDRTAMRLATGVRDVDILPYGVDAEQFQPMTVPERPESLVFWGRLDFMPNVQALEWFFESGTWSTLRSRFPQATFTMMGFAPNERVKGWAAAPGVQLLANVDDIRPVVSAHSAVVLPMVTGAGIKNKLLEAAAMGKPIVCTKRSTLGLQGTPPLLIADTPSEFVEAIGRLWASAERREELSKATRAWVTSQHSWEAAARLALEGVAASVEAKRRSNGRH